MTGFIFLDKPEGITSFTAVNKVKRMLNIKKAGHTGTLDPMATGVLPIMLGGATKFSQYLPSHDKDYQAKIKLGITTDTLDITGNILSKNEVDVTDDELCSIVSSFIGDIKQLPPMYSAVSKNGVRLYKLARQGIEIEREARDVTVHRISITEPLGKNNEFVIDVSCSAGTYIRSLADDIGKKAGCGAVITSLRRTAANGISIDRTVTLDRLSEIAENGDINSVIVSCAEMLSVFSAVYVSEKQAVLFRNGGGLFLTRIQNRPSDGICRVYSPENVLLGLGKINNEENLMEVEKILVNI